MQQALAAPVFRSILFAVAALSLGAVYVSTTDHEVSHRLALHAVDEPGAIYLSAFRKGDISVTFKKSELSPITFHIQASVSDGCRWLGIETLVPTDARTFHYDYSERILDCDADATPARKTPRTGTVTVED